MLMGESNTGSWRTHTPFCTTASTAQPTEQCEHTVRRTTMSSLPSAALASPTTVAFFTSDSCDAASPAPTPMPERLRKVRRSMVGSAPARPRARLPDSVAAPGRLACPVLASCAAGLRVRSMVSPGRGGTGIAREPGGWPQIHVVR